MTPRGHLEPLSSLFWYREWGGVERGLRMGILDSYYSFQCWADCLHVYLSPGVSLLSVHLLPSQYFVRYSPSAGMKRMLEVSRLDFDFWGG